MLKTVAIVLFVINYVLLLSLPKRRAWIAATTAILFILLSFLPAFATLLPIGDVFGTIDWNVLMMIGGTMIAVDLFIDSKMPALLADFIIEKTPNVKWAVIAMAVFAGLISAFIDNVATVLIVAPIALTISKRLNISPVASVISIAVFSNLEGAATLVGDTTSILLGGYANMTFMDFFWFDGKLGPFFIVQLGLLASVVVLLVVFRKSNQPISIHERVEVKDYVPTVLLVGIIVALIGASFIPAEYKLPITNGLITVTIGTIGLLYDAWKHKTWDNAKEVFAKFDYQTLILLAGLFLVIGGITNAGVIDDIAGLIVQIGGTDPFVVYTIVVIFSVLVSAFIDNIPYVATMLPVMVILSATTGAPQNLLFLGLLFGATLGGNLTPIGASANITGIGILRKEGYEVTLKDYIKIGIPVTLVAVTVGYLLTLVIYG